MRIALFSSTIDSRDGYGNITKEYCAQLHRLGQPFVLFLPQSQKEAIDTTDYPFEIRFVLPEYIFRIYQPKALGYFRSIDVSEFDLVHSLFAFPYCVLAQRSAKKYKKPYIMGAQGTHGVRPLAYFPEKLFLKSCYKHAAAITVPSDYTRRKICEYAGVEYPITVIHNGVHFDRFQKDVDVQSIRDRYKGKKILLTVGGLWGRKGHDLVLQMLYNVTQKYPDIVYTIVGDGNSRENLEKLATELGVRDSVDFVGRKSGDELVAYFKACDVYVHTPKVLDLKFEGFGIVYLEASACGKPIVATDAGGIRDAVVDGETGLIADDGDVQGIADRVLQLLDDPNAAVAMGEAGLKYAKKNDWNSIAQQFIHLYSQAHE
ncbi:MAG: glycosyltransferase family 4 protein [Candidatus Peribacteraceae bacterium]|jgi:phosphatidylinositol alpha-1,6-mannosyltransferase|nr:glycosyltransferase family 4 protein [Candidatus Peribacteraceae bacterium]|tara:strand:+ start:739 stop:1860 length:1122 start_codon:yes stop_codon:yes gene_type:complete